MNYIGIDPGYQGAIAVISAVRPIVFYKKGEGIPEIKTGISIRVEDIPVVKDSLGKTVYDIARCREVLGNMATTLQDSFAILEKSQTMPQQSSQSSFTIGAGYMLWKVLLTVLNIPFLCVRPQKWQKEFSIQKCEKKTKIQAYEVAQQLYPKAELTTKRGKILDGRCDALLIATYGKRLNENKE